MKCFNAKKQNVFVWSYLCRAPSILVSFFVFFLKTFFMTVKHFVFFNYYYLELQRSTVYVFLK